MSQDWCEIESQDTYPAPGHSWSRFFRNQEDLVHLRVSADLNASLAGVAAVILAVRHSEYLELDPDEVVRAAGVRSRWSIATGFWMTAGSRATLNWAEMSRGWDEVTSSGLRRACAKATGRLRASDRSVAAVRPYRCFGVSVAASQLGVSVEE